MARGKRQDGHKTTNVVLIVLGLFVLAFVAAMTVTYWKFQSVPDTLIQYTLGAGGAEALFLAGIKIAKVLSGEKEKPPHEGGED